MKKIMILFFALAMMVSAHAQYSLLSPSSATFETVTNAGTTYLSTVAISPAAATSTTFWVAVTKTSGTVGGTITLQGSFDGTNWKALNQPNSQTALATITPADASATYHWNISASPFIYYRVTWTGAGTMVATFTAQMYRAK